MGDIVHLNPKIYFCFQLRCLYLLSDIVLTRDKPFLRTSTSIKKLILMINCMKLCEITLNANDIYFQKYRILSVFKTTRIDKQTPGLSWIHVDMCRYTYEDICG